MPNTIQGQLKALIVLLAIAWIPVFVDAGAVARAVQLFPMSVPQQPYFVQDHAWLLYIWAPIVVTSGNVLLMSPGLCMALAFKPFAPGAAAWIVSGTLLGLVTTSTVVEFAEAISDTAFTGTAFAVLVAGVSLVAWCLTYIRHARSSDVSLGPLQRSGNLPVIALTLMGPVVLLITLAPKFYWESFNGDGAHSYEVSRLLLSQATPFFPTDAGPVSDFPGVTSMLFAYPGAWFLRLYGNYEVAARLPYLLYLAVTYCAMVTVLETGRSRHVDVLQGSLLWFALGIYTVALAFSATYDPYSADLALPATQDTLLVFCFVSFVAAFIIGTSNFWISLATVLTYLSLPSGTMLIALWLGAVTLLWRPIPTGRVVVVTVTLAACLAAAAVFTKLVTLLGFSLPGNEYALQGLLRRFEVVQWQHVERFAYFVLPSGILAAIALLAWPVQDRVSRALTAVCCAYLVIFYFQVHVSLHHFVPLMLLPLLVFWRTEFFVGDRHRNLTYVATAATCIVALVLSLPTSSSPFLDAKLIGRQIEDRVGGYEHHDPAVYRRAEMLRHLFPATYDKSVPASAFGASPLVLNWYANNSTVDHSEANYVFQRETDPSPFGDPPAVTEDGWALYIKDWESYQTHHGLRPPSPAGSPVYEVPRWILFSGMPTDENVAVINLRDLARSIVRGFSNDGGR